jgi:hypothetical protein
MSRIKDKTSGKEYEGVTFNTLSASIAASSDNTFKGVKFDFVGIDKVPNRVKQGDQAKFLNLNKIATGSGGGIFRDTVKGIVYIPFRKQDFQEMSIGETSFVKETFNTDAYDTISSSFAAQFNNISNDTLITFLTQEFYTGSTADGFVGSVTASFDTFTPDGLTSSFSGIDTGDGYDMTLDFSNSNFVTNQLISFPPGGDAHTLRTATFIPIFQHKFVNSGSRLTPAFNNTVNKALITSSLASINGILGLDASATGSPSGSNCGIGTIININGTNRNDGTYSRNLFKGRVGGDADSGSIAVTNDDLLPSREYIIYPAGTRVASGSFRYFADTGNSASLGTSNSRREIIIATTSSNDIRTLFYSEVLTGVSNGPSGSHTGSRFLHGSDIKDLGSPVHSDPLLQTTASVGFYAPLGHTSADGCFEINTASFDNGGNNLGTIKMMVPRIKSKVTISGT